MRLYDTLSKTKKELKPISDKKIGIFVCGPTVYEYSHIGHARTYVAFDVFVKYLRFQKFEVRYVQNITNIDDKIIDRARELNESPLDLAKTFETEYLHDMEKLGVTSPDNYARATDYMRQIIDQISRLMKKGYAYQSEDGIYYDILKFKDYGKLSGRTAKQAEDAISRIDESVQKKNRGDFALWKFKKDDEPFWPSPWGDGRPGWHIEDTAITESELGSQYDIHGGARDLIFPHHESEIAQMEAISGKQPLVNHWMHTGFLTIGGEKMSKSLGNFITVHELLKKYSKETFRMFVLSSHYRNPIDYKEAALRQAKANVERLEEFYFKIYSFSANSIGKGAVQNFPKKYADEFYAELDDDFNTPKALAVLFELVRDGNTKILERNLPQSEARGILSFLDDINSTLGTFPTDFHTEIRREIPEEILDLMNSREKLRKDEKWKEADQIRHKIEVMGYKIEDSSKGARVKKI